MRLTITTSSILQFIVFFFPLLLSTALSLPQSTTTNLTLTNQSSDTITNKTLGSPPKPEIKTYQIPDSQLTITISGVHGFVTIFNGTDYVSDLNYKLNTEITEMGGSTPFDSFSDHSSYYHVLVNLGSWCFDSACEGDFTWNDAKAIFAVLLSMTRLAPDVGPKAVQVGGIRFDVMKGSEHVGMGQLGPFDVWDDNDDDDDEVEDIQRRDGGCQCCDVVGVVKD